VTQKFYNPLQHMIPHTVTGRTNIVVIINLSFLPVPLSFSFLSLSNLITTYTTLAIGLHKRTLKASVGCIHTPPTTIIVWHLSPSGHYLFSWNFSVPALARDCCLLGICLFEVIRAPSFPLLPPILFFISL